MKEGQKETRYVLNGPWFFRSAAEERAQHRSLSGSTGSSAVSARSAIPPMAAAVPSLPGRPRRLSRQADLSGTYNNSHATPTSAPPTGHRGQYGSQVAGDQTNLSARSANRRHKLAVTALNTWLSAAGSAEGPIFWPVDLYGCGLVPYLAACTAEGIGLNGARVHD